MTAATQRRASRVEVRLLGPVGASVDGEPVAVGGGRQRSLLAALASERGRVVSTGALIDAVWDGDPPDGADVTLRSYVSRLRRAFQDAGADGAAVVVTDAAGYRLDARLVTIDADAFEVEVAAARDQLAAGAATAAAAAIERALDRWQGRALGAVADQVWASPTATRLEEERLAARELQVRALLDGDRVDRAVTLAEQLAAAEPLRESVARLLALALHRTGREAEALQALRRFRDHLADEHGLDPSPQLEQLERMVLERDPRLERSVGGRRLRGYVLREPFARSALGTVHRGEQPSVGREVAITVLPAAIADDPDVIRAFEARVQAVASVEHPHVLPVHDYWREPGGAYVVTRFPSGGTLGQRLERGPLSTDEALRIGEQVAAAIAAAHDAGVVHGGVDADAVVLDDNGDAFVWAFGVDPDEERDSDLVAVARLVRRVAQPGGAPTAEPLLPEPAGTTLRRAVQPGSELTVRDLASSLAATRSADGPTPPVRLPAGPNPYRGLAAFRETDEAVFFGRDALVQEIRARLDRLHGVAVVGPSGAGKSSVVHAGVLPALRAAGAYVTTMRPGLQPLAELELALARVAAAQVTGVAASLTSDPGLLPGLVERALPDAAGDLVLVVDQFEELFTMAPPSDRDRFLDALRSAVDAPDARVRVVVTLRADFLAEVLGHPVAGTLVRDRSVMVGPMTGAELEEVVTRPAALARVTVEPALVASVVADATRFPGSLPMVQFALREVFEAAEGGVMTLAAYERIGGIEGVLGQRAEEAHEHLDEDGRAAVRWLFQRLVAPREGARPVRRRARRTELAHVPDAVVTAFGRARLLRFDHDEGTREPTVEVTHEALFEAWPRLAAWVEEDRAGLVLLGHLTEAAGAWEASGRPTSELYRGARLDAALAYRASHAGQLTATEEAFLDAAVGQRDEDATQTAQVTRRQRLLTAGVAAGLALAMLVGVVALVQRDRARAGQDLLVARDLAAASLSVAATDAELSLLLALEATKASPRDDGGALPEVEDALHRAVVGHRVLLRVQGLGGSVDWHPGGELFLTEGLEGSGVVDLRDAMAGASTRSFDGHDADINDVVFSGDGSLLATAGDDGLLRVFDTATGELRAEVRGRGEVWGASFSADGSRVAAAWTSEDLVRIHDVTGAGPDVEVQAVTAGLSDSTSFRPDGRHLAIADVVRGVAVVDASSGEDVLALGVDTVGARAVAWSPDGGRLAVAGDGTAQLRDAATGALQASLEGDVDGVHALDWAPAGDRLATGGSDGVARVFEVTGVGAVEQVELAVGGGIVTGVAFSPDGDRLLTGDIGVTAAVVWDLGPAGGEEWANLPTWPSGRSDAVFGRTGDELVASGVTTRAAVWDLSSRTAPDPIGEGRLGGATQIELRPDGAVVLTEYGERAFKEVEVWDRQTGERAFPVWLGQQAMAATWVPDSDQVAVVGLKDDGAGGVGALEVLDDVGAPTREIVGEPNRQLIAVAFHPDGRRAVTASLTGDPRAMERSFDAARDGIRVWDVATGEVLAEVNEWVLGIASDPTGTRFATWIGPQITVRDATSLEELVVLEGHTGEVHDVAFSRDGGTVASASSDGSVRLWDAASGVQQLVLDGHADDPVWSVAFSPDGDRLVSTGAGVARVWALDIDDLVTIAEQRLTRSMTEAECLRYLGRGC